MNQLAPVQLTEDEAQAELADFALPSARGNRKREIPVTVEVVRELGAADIPLLLDPPPVAAEGPRIVQIRNSHHNLAQLLSKGLDHGTVSLMTGYSMSHISILMGDPSFQALYEHYLGVKEQVFVDVLERMKIVGLNSLDELQDRLEHEPHKFSNREMMEMAEMLLIKPLQVAATARGANAGGPGTQISISFVTPGDAGTAVRAGNQTIEGTVLDEE